MMMKMMGAKLWAAIYALLLINVGSAKHGRQCFCYFTSDVSAPSLRHVD